MRVGRPYTSEPMELLHPGAGTIPANAYVPAGPGTGSWGLLPNAMARPVLTVPSGAAVTIDTVSHEGILEDQGRDPVAFFAAAGIGEVLADAVAVASDGEHDPAVHGPHVVTGPVSVEGARPGDVLEVEVLALTPRAPYGVISNRHGKGALAGEYPRPPAGARAGDPVPPVSLVATVGGDGRGILPVGDGRFLRFPLAPFLGIMGVAAATGEPVHSVPPGPYGGNLDVALLVTGSRLYLPVQVPGALFYIGDPHFSMGDGEVALTAFEAPLRATVRLRVHSDAVMRRLAAGLAVPFAETTTEHLILGLDRDLDEAVRQAARGALTFLRERYGIPAQVALAYLSAAADFHISQVVDIVKGVHCCLRKEDLP